MKVLIVSGKAGSGKSFFADQLQHMYEKVYGLRVAQLAFADPLKMVAKNLYGWDGEKGESGRHLLQELGTDIVQQNNILCWTNCIIEIMKGLETEFDLFIISDARFAHEIDHTKDSLPLADIITVRIEGKTSLAGEASEHSSETDLDEYVFDYHFPNRDYDMSIFFYNLITLVKRTMGE